MNNFDREHIWHPYTSMTDPLPVYNVVAAEGVRITLDDGRELIDGMASWWCAIHGYNHPVLNKAAQEQLQSFAHVMFGGLAHAPATRLAEQLISISPEPLQHIFFSDSGSVSVEVAIKMALQYWQTTGHPNKSRLLTVRGGYHGDTFGAMAVCDPVNGMHTLFSEALPDHLFAPRPASRFGETLGEGDIDELQQLLEKNHLTIAAVILEPIVQGAGGMWFYSAEYLSRVRDLCDDFDVLLILDEIATGFGRTGKMFACEHANIAPDIMCVGKSLTGGYMSLAATLSTTRVAEGISANGGVLMHGPTFMANALACAVASASIGLLLQDQWQERVSRLEQVLRDRLGEFAAHPSVSEVRVLGGIGVVETYAEVPVADIQQLFVSAGVWIRPFRNLIYIMPPYVIAESDLHRLCDAIGGALNRLQGSTSKVQL